MANNTNHELQVRPVDALLMAFRQRLVTKDNVIFNTDYEGQPTAGAVRIPYADEVTVSDYDLADGLAPTLGNTSYVTVPISKYKAVNELIPNYVAEAVPYDMFAKKLDSAGYKLAATHDNIGLTLLAGADTVTFTSTDPRYGKAATAVTMALTDSPFQTIVDGHQAQTEANVPVEGRYILASAQGKGLLIKDKENFVKQGDLSQAMMQTGAVGAVDGAAVYETNGLPTDVLFILGHPSGATRIQEFAQEPKIVSLDQSGKWIASSAVQALQIYEYALVHPEAFVIIRKPATQTPDTPSETPSEGSGTGSE